MSGPAFQGGLDRAGVPLVDGIDKVTGRARYTADLDHAGALVARILRSPISHGEIARLDISRALALKGVAAIVTGEDCAITYGVLPIAMNEYPMARDRVRYRGEPIAAVAAVDEETAQRALDLIEWNSESSRPTTSPRLRAPRMLGCCTTTSPAISNAKFTTSSAISPRASKPPT
jgi:4-hydroxybenzoyl-CoA reductase subunit alpha